ncbi:TIM barrel protein [Candidatus Woesearchaeota archaeon]|nr:TIM barrel protein [Candidatus Woesearchaeota archaeon]
MTIKIAPAGNVDSDGLVSLRKIKEFGLDGQEIEFVRQVYMDNKTAKEVGQLAEKLGLFLSIHASYFVNLCSEEKEKVDASKRRILEACERAHYLNAENVVFHAGYYGKRSKQETYNLIKKEMVAMQEIIKANSWNKVKLCPETTGKKSQFGDLYELLRLREEIKCNICVDFAHLLARNGRINYGETISQLPQKFHAHFSGIEYSDKGERKHIPIDEKEFEKLAKELLRQKKDITIVCEAPDPFGDALRMKNIIDSIK